MRIHSRCTRVVARMVLVAAAIGSVWASSPAPATTHPNDEPADLVMRNGVIETVDPVLGQVSALAARDGRIIAVSRTDDLEAMIGPDTTVIDLDGRFAMPGFIESHGHFLGVGQSRMNLNLMNVANWDDVIALVKDAVDAAEPGEWITGRGWHQEKWDQPPEDAVEGFPTHDDLSAISPENPVFLVHASGHASFANKAAMDASGISGTTEDPPGGEILRDAQGLPIGVFRETASGLVRVPAAGRRQSPADREALFRRTVQLATEECLSKGVTSFQDAGTPLVEIDQLRRLAESGSLNIRLWMMIRDRNEAVERHGPDVIVRRAGGDKFTVGGLKLSIDGALGARGAWLLEPYADAPESTGLNTVTIERATDAARIAKELDLQLCIHAIGDRANREVLDLYERTLDLEANPDHRWRIEHAQHLHPDDIPRFGSMGVIAAMQGIHCTSDAPWVYARLGEKRAREGAYMWRDLLDTGAIIANGTDAPVEDVDPIASFDATVNRRLKDGSVFFADQRMSRMEAIRSYTIDAAFAAREEDCKGSLVPGKLADIVVLSQNLLNCSDADVRRTTVDMTILDGVVVFERK